MLLARIVWPFGLAAKAAAGHVARPPAQPRAANRELMTQLNAAYPSDVATCGRLSGRRPVRIKMRGHELAG